MFQLHFTFKGGKCDGKTAIATVPGFQIGMEIDINGEIYIAGGGPIAQHVEKTQKPVDHTCLVAVLKHSPESN